MAQNLVIDIIQSFSPAIMNQLSAAVGINRDTTQRAVGGAVPAVLAGLLGIASRPGGADRLSAAVAQTSSLGMPGAANRSTPQDSATMIEQGSSLLSSLFGSQGVDGLGGALAHYASLDQGIAGKLLGFVTPLILGFLGRQPAGAGAGGLANMLLGQKDAIAAALPQVMANRLQGSGLLSGIADRLTQGASSAAATAKSGAAALGETASGAATAGASYAGQKPSAGALPGWLLGLAALVILALLGYWLWGGRQVQQASHAPVNMSTPAGGSGTSTAALDLKGQLTGAFDKTRDALEQVSDADSAKRALPRINESVAQLDKLQSAAAQSPEPEKKALAQVIDKAQPALKQIIDKTLAIPGVSDVLKPALDAFQSKLAALSAA